MKFVAEKLFDGFSTCFRQHKAVGTHCSFLHGYAVSFRVTFEGALDYRNWVWDFGGMKRAKNKIDGKTPSEYFSWLLDHTVLVSQNDPALEDFKKLDRENVIQLRVLEHVGCERLAEHLYHKINSFLHHETSGRVRATKVEVFEHQKNSAAYMESSNA